MKKHYILIPVLFFLAFALAACSDSTSDPVGSSPVAAKGSAKITTFPLGAKVFIDGAAVSYTTPYQYDSLTPGWHKVKVEFTLRIFSASFSKDDSTVTINDSVNVTSSTVASKTITAYNLNATYTDKTVYETNAPASVGGSAVILATGTVTTFPNTAMDIYFRSTDSLISAIFSNRTDIKRETYFHEGGAIASFDDETINPPVYSSTDATWKEGMPYNDQAKFYWLYNDDGHYSKVKVTSFGKASDYAYSTLAWKFYKMK